MSNQECENKKLEKLSKLCLNETNKSELEIAVNVSAQDDLAFQAHKDLQVSSGQLGFNVTNHALDLSQGATLLRPSDLQASQLTQLTPPTTLVPQPQPTQLAQQLQPNKLSSAEPLPVILSTEGTPSNRTTGDRAQYANVNYGLVNWSFEGEELKKFGNSHWKTKLPKSEFVSLEFIEHLVNDVVQQTRPYWYLSSIFEGWNQGPLSLLRFYHNAYHKQAQSQKRKLGMQGALSGESFLGLKDTFLLTLQPTRYRLQYLLATLNAQAYDGNNESYEQEFEEFIKQSFNSTGWAYFTYVLHHYEYLICRFQVRVNPDLQIIVLETARSMGRQLLTNINETYGRLFAPHAPYFSSRPGEQSGLMPDQGVPSEGVMPGVNALLGKEQTQRNLKLQALLGQAQHSLAGLTLLFSQPDNPLLECLTEAWLRQQITASRLTLECSPQYQQSLNSLLSNQCLEHVPAASYYVGGQRGKSLLASQWRFEMYSSLERLPVRVLRALVACGHKQNEPKQELHQRLTQLLHDLGLKSELDPHIIDNMSEFAHMCDCQPFNYQSAVRKTKMQAQAKGNSWTQTQTQAQAQALATDPALEQIEVHDAEQVMNAVQAKLKTTAAAKISTSLHTAASALHSADYDAGYGMSWGLGLGADAELYAESEQQRAQEEELIWDIIRKLERLQDKDPVYFNQLALGQDAAGVLASLWKQCVSMANIWSKLIQECGFETCRMAFAGDQAALRQCLLFTGSQLPVLLDKVWVRPGHAMKLAYTTNLQNKGKSPLLRQLGLRSLEILSEVIDLRLAPHESALTHPWAGFKSSSFTRREPLINLNSQTLIKLTQELQRCRVKAEVINTLQDYAIPHEIISHLTSLPREHIINELLVLQDWTISPKSVVNLLLYELFALMLQQTDFDVQHHFMGALIASTLNVPVHQCFSLPEQVLLINSLQLLSRLPQKANSLRVTNLSLVEHKRRTTQAVQQTPKQTQTPNAPAVDAPALAGQKLGGDVSVDRRAWEIPFLSPKMLGYDWQRALVKKLNQVHVENLTAIMGTVESFLKPCATTLDFACNLMILAQVALTAERGHVPWTLFLLSHLYGIYIHGVIHNLNSQLSYRASRQRGAYAQTKAQDQASDQSLMQNQLQPRIQPWIQTQVQPQPQSQIQPRAHGSAQSQAIKGKQRKEWSKPRLLVSDQMALWSKLLGSKSCIDQSAVIDNESLSEVINYPLANSVLQSMVSLYFNWLRWQGNIVCVTFKKNQDAQLRSLLQIADIKHRYPGPTDFSNLFEQVAMVDGDLSAATCGLQDMLYGSLLDILLPLPPLMRQKKMRQLVEHWPVHLEAGLAVNPKFVLMHLNDCELLYVKVLQDEVKLYYSVESAAHKQQRLAKIYNSRIFQSSDQSNAYGYSPIIKPGQGLRSAASAASLASASAAASSTSSDALSKVGVNAKKAGSSDSQIATKRGVKVVTFASESNGQAAEGGGESKASNELELNTYTFKPTSIDMMQGLSLESYAWSYVNFYHHKQKVDAVKHSLRLKDFVPQTPQECLQYLESHQWHNLWRRPAMQRLQLQHRYHGAIDLCLAKSVHTMLVQSCKEIMQHGAAKNQGESAPGYSQSMFGETRNLPVDVTQLLPSFGVFLFTLQALENQQAILTQCSCGETVLEFNQSLLEDKLHQHCRYCNSTLNDIGAVPRVIYANMEE